MIENGIHGDSRGTSRVEFTAPAEPGVYYITQAITLAYSYCNVHFPNHPKDSFAAIRVLQPGWNETVVLTWAWILLDYFTHILRRHTAPHTSSSMIFQMTMSIAC